MNYKRNWNQCSPLRMKYRHFGDKNLHWNKIWSLPHLLRDKVLAGFGGGLLGVAAAMHKSCKGGA